ncbi:MAG: SdrD B-like domain-containing protein [Saprospiraceae bacterium]
MDTLEISSLPKEICSESDVTIHVIHSDNAIPLTLIGLDNPFVLGDTIIVRDTGIISYQPNLINNSGHDQIVTYKALAVYNNDTISKWHQVLVHPAVDVQFTPNNGFTCAGKCIDFEAFITSEFDTISQFDWIGDNIKYNSSSKVTICPDSSSIYTVTAIDAFGCIGVDSFSVSVVEGMASCSNPFDIGEVRDNVLISGNNTCGILSQYCPQNNESTVWLSFSVAAGFEMPMYVGLLGLKNGIVTLLDDQCNEIASNCSSTLIIPTLTAGKTYYFAVSSSNINAGEFRLSIDDKDFNKTISGYVYLDNNSSGKFDQGDFHLRKIKVDLFSGCQQNLPASPIATTFTNRDGSYYFSNLPFGEYTVRIDKTVPGSPDDSSSPPYCCIMLTPATTSKELECDMGYPPPNCAENPYSVSNNCDEAFNNPLCDLTVIEQWPCGQNPLLPGIWNGMAHCGNNFENTSFYGFVAGTGDYQIEFTIFSCGGIGVEYGIYSACEPDAGPICDGNANSGTIVVDASQLTPCQTYVFWIDGAQGSVCSYFVHVIGDFTSCGRQEITSIEVDYMCDHVCPTSAHPYTIKASTLNYNNLKYNWFITHPDNVKDTITNAGLELDYLFEKIGDYEICVESPHGCGNFGTIFCQKIQSKIVNDVSKDIALCSEEFPFTSLKDYNGDDVLDPNGIPWSWDQGAITQDMVENGQTIFVSQKDDGCGCSYQQTIHILIDNAKTNHYKIALCEDLLPFEFADTTFTTNVDSFKLQIDTSSSLYTCDSIVYLTTQILDPAGQISQSTCENGQYTLLFMPADTNNLQNIDSVHFNWTYPNGGGTVQSNTWKDGLIVPSTVVGKFTLEIILYKFGQSCSKTHSFTSDCISDTENESLRGKVFIVPNPASNTISLQNYSGFKVVRFQMYNSLGAEILTMTSEFNLMSVNHLYSGIYQCRIQFEDGRIISLPMVKL